ncbi:hypothetical protein VPHF86_0205 [Vibrio phage F86]
MNRTARNTLRVVANDMLSEERVLSNRSAFSCILLANRVHRIHLNSALGAVEESDAHDYVESLGKLFVSYVKLNPDVLGFELNQMPPARGAFVHMFATYGKDDVYDSDERFVLARKAWLKFVTEQ